MESLSRADFKQIFVPPCTPKSCGMETSGILTNQKIYFGGELDRTTLKQLRVKTVCISFGIGATMP